MARIEEGHEALRGGDVAGPTALALVVACDSPLTFPSGTTPARGPCAYDLSIDVDPNASSNDIVGQWEIGPDGSVRDTTP